MSRSRFRKLEARAARDRAADVADAERREQVGERPAPRVVDGRDEVRRRELAETLQAHEVFAPRGGSSRPRRREGRPSTNWYDALLAEALDVHGAARGEVDDPLHALRRAVGVDAVGVALALEADERPRRSSGTCSGSATARCRLCPGAQHRPDDLGDDVSRLAHDDGVAGPDVFQADLVLVVQAGEADHRPGDADGLQLGERRRPPGAPDRDEDVLEQGRLLLGRELVGDRPPGRVRGGPEAGHAAPGRPPSPRRRRSRSRARGGATRGRGSRRRPTPGPAPFASPG